MSNPGPVEREPLKVVPMFIDESTPTLPPEVEPDDPVVVEAPPSRPRPWVGALGIALGLSAAVVQAVAIVVATGGDAEMGILLGYLAVMISIVAILAGIIAMVVRRGRRTGAAAIAVGLLANPLVLLGILRFIGGAAG